MARVRHGPISGEAVARNHIESIHLVRIPRFPRLNLAHKVEQRRGRSGGELWGGHAAHCVVGGSSCILFCTVSFVIFGCLDLLWSGPCCADKRAFEKLPCQATMQATHLLVHVLGLTRGNQKEAHGCSRNND